MPEPEYADETERMQAEADEQARAAYDRGFAEGRRQATEGWERGSDAEEVIAREYGYFLLQEGAAERTGDFAEWIVGHLAEAGFEVRRRTSDGEREWGIWVPDLRDGHVLACDYEAHAREVLAGSGPGPVVISRLVGPWEPDPATSHAAPTISQPWEQQEPDEQPEPVAVERMSAETIASVLAVVDAPYRPGLNVEFDDEPEGDA